MKVLGQSILVDARPYVHLGYTAATMTVPDAKLMSATGAMSIAGVVLALIALISTVRARYRRMKCSVRARIGVGILALVLLIGGGVALLAAYQNGKEVRRYPAGYTWSQVPHVAFTINDRLEQATTRPTLDELRKDFAEQLCDGWERAMRLESGVIDGETYYIITSAGLDGTFGTNDDVAYDTKIFLELKKARTTRASESSR